MTWTGCESTGAVSACAIHALAYFGSFLWLPPDRKEPSDGLLAIATVAVVGWTGGFIAKAWLQRTSIGFVVGMDALQIAFFGPLVVLISTPPWLRIVAVITFVYYGSLYLDFVDRLRHPKSARQRLLTLLFPMRPEESGIIDGTVHFVRTALPGGKREWHKGQIRQLIAYAAVAIYPDREVAAVIAALYLWFGYQRLLVLLYIDLYTPRNANVRAALDDVGAKAKSLGEAIERATKGP